MLFNGTAPGPWFPGLLAPTSSPTSGSFAIRPARMVLSSATRLAGWSVVSASALKWTSLRRLHRLSNRARSAPSSSLRCPEAGQFIRWMSPTPSSTAILRSGFIVSSTGFVDASLPGHVCLLSRSLYGLKQAPRAWYQRIAGFLQTLGFSVTRSDASLFVYRQIGRAHV